MIAVEAVPHWKVFTFGGNSGDLSMEAGQPLGTFLNDLVGPDLPDVPLICAQ